MRPSGFVGKQRYCSAAAEAGLQCGEAGRRQEGDGGVEPGVEARVRPAVRHHNQRRWRGRHRRGVDGFEAVRRIGGAGVSRDDLDDFGRGAPMQLRRNRIDREVSPGWDGTRGS